MKPFLRFITLILLSFFLFTAAAHATPWKFKKKKSSSSAHDKSKKKKKKSWKKKDDDDVIDADFKEV